MSACAWRRERPRARRRRARDGGRAAGPDTQEARRSAQPHRRVPHGARRRRREGVPRRVPKRDIDPDLLLLDSDDDYFFEDATTVRGSEVYRLDVAAARWVKLGSLPGDTALFVSLLLPAGRQLPGNRTVRTWIGD
ncbi:hypothetical protein PR202_ga21704 [Eleusine coracana subsp. coracana]|uniref:Uncharacterized protein n=1 Tax=Eleusine coracana subsp. coracana TaxID=191504 RepID=A0AAV5D2B6_ELECO|nr:hypothetical protein PR202_ga21704 [Eleusine coracana subsp. coracana]